ncbi:TOBE domain-containing protein [Halpernia frigidisoli]|uniref:Molybdenum-pterin binding domain-containing protein n=1 Tax=Halpernia frigidisoli TaxID=1125876 RepID=A0A1I3E5A9_9FLAO|nr:TOBE domain-containing protein [Halpernia frigidisoli]SFH94154.1 molybdenum-pterin binding domain-containing protein [Halpernia frigidisoli]
MNTFQGKITKIESSESLSLVQILVDDVLFKTILLETPETADYLKENQSVNLYFKETEVVLAKRNVDFISMQNKISGIISNIEKDVLLSKVEIKTEIGFVKSIITTFAVEQLQLKIGDKVTALIKTNEIMISE